MSRPRRTATMAAGAGTDGAGPSRNVPPPLAADEDPDYVALSNKQRRAIDRAFERGVRTLEGRNRKVNKRRKVEERSIPLERDAGGGFMSGDGDDDGGGGGFMLDDDGDGIGGGFLPDDEEGGGGGFLPDDNDNDGGFLPETNNVSTPVSTSTPTSSKRRIPLYLLPSLLASLGLPSDEDVLQVFRASASGWADDDANDDDPSEVLGRRKRAAGGGGEEDEMGVELKDFRAVCAALMGPEEEGDGDENMDGSGNDDEEEEDAFELSDEENGSDTSSLTGSEYGASTSNRRNKTTQRVKVTDFARDDAGGGEIATRSKGKGGRSRKTRIEGKPKLSTKQKELAKDIWDMLKPPSTGKQSGRESGILGREEVKHWVRTLGEMWSDEEITEMVTLFSSQHEGRGLTLEDFGGIMLRAGLV
ncbi:hypothetical protein CI109_106102 [Kwoniella shandongensis]|uniref:Uncharacterized protein n=1 Tax=Kwoniella shandongensis TaxID=1734106 RepID=A0A5M6BWA8_9TREE|nr:uncharacterized protein CI109_006360 [Kwoniella shandongensis]KAA5525289.1 hypothetical protein CI109_006360 [Kwoniella shandongensis]